MKKVVFTFFIFLFIPLSLLAYSKYIIPFELTSVILLVALVGAIILAKKDEKEEDSNE